jgi:glycerol-3-phosphate dehydrogenase
MMAAKRVLMMDIDGNTYWGTQTSVNRIISQGSEFLKRGSRGWPWVAQDDGETRKIVRQTGAQRRKAGNPRKVKGKSTTLRNMASVTVTKLPNGVVKITGRKMAQNPAKRKYKPRIKGGNVDGQYTGYYDYKTGKVLYKRKKR